MNREAILNKVTYHAVYDDSIIDALRYAKRNGFAGVQVAIETPHLSFENLTDADCSEIRDFVVSNGLMLSIHCPDDVTSLFATSKYLLDGIFSFYEALFAFAEKAGAHLITFHIGQMPSFSTDTNPCVRIPQADMIVYASALKQNLDRLIELAAGRFVLCVENYKMDAAVLDILQPYLIDGNLSLCWDLAKTYDGTQLKADIMSYFTSNLEHIRQVHLHDYIPGKHSHRVIGTGQVDFMKLLSLLNEADVREYCIEVRPREKAKESLDNLAVLLA